MQSKLRLLHLSDLLRSAAARGSSCLKLKSCSQSFLGEDDCQRLQRLVGCSSVVTGNSFHKVHHVTARVRRTRKGTKKTNTNTQTFFLCWKQFSQSSSHSQTNLERKRQKQRKKAKNTCLLRRSSICIGIINLYLYLYYQFVFVFVFVFVAVASWNREAVASNWHLVSR